MNRILHRIQFLAYLEVDERVLDVLPHGPHLDLAEPLAQEVCLLLGPLQQLGQLAVAPVGCRDRRMLPILHHMRHRYKNNRQVSLN